MPDGMSKNIGYACDGFKSHLITCDNNFTIASQFDVTRQILDLIVLLSKLSKISILILR